MTFSMLSFAFTAAEISQNLHNIFLKIIEAFQYSLWEKPFSSQKDKSWCLKSQDLSP